MEIGTLFALKVLAGIFGFGVGLVLGSLVSAIWLRLAALWLGFGRLEYRAAFKCALLANFVVAVIQFAIGFNYGVTLQLLTDASTPIRNWSFGFTPVYYLGTIVLGLVITASLFRRIIKNEADDSQVSFGDSFALASLYFALTSAFMILLAMVVFLLLAGIMFLL